MPQQNQPLNYASRPQPQPHQTLGPGIFYWAAIGCGVFPMLVILICYVIYSSNYSATAWRLGVKMIPIAPALVLLGALCCFAWRKKLAHATPTPADHPSLNPVLAILGANFPVIFICILLGLNAARKSYVHVINESGLRIDSCELVYPGGSYPIGPIEKGSSTKWRESSPPDGAYHLVIQKGGITSSIPVETLLSGGPMHVNIYLGAAGNRVEKLEE